MSTVVAERTLIQGALVITMDESTGADPVARDVLIEGDRVAAVEPHLEPGAGDTVIDGRSRLVMPGLVNAHVHSWEALFKGRYDNLPLELWMLFSYPILGLTPLSRRLVYLRTLLVAMESLKNGVTCLLDDVIEMPGQSMDALEAVFDAYELAGIRANCSGNVMDRAFTDTLPFTDELLPQELVRAARAERRTSISEYLAFSEEALDRFHGRAGRLRYVVAPSGPQRCSDELLIAAAELSERHATAYHIHVLETKVQAVTGQEMYGRSMVRHLDELGVLNERATLAHVIWVDDEDIARLARARASVAHNAISNQKLGAGIAPFRKLLDAGVNVALGSDGISSNDTPRMFDVMKAAALLHKVTSPDYTTWPSAPEILAAATIAGARSAAIGDEVGSLESGKRADLLILDLRSLNFTPLNDIRNHLVYCEDGSSIEKVMVGGEVVVEKGALTRLDEEAVLEELRTELPAVLNSHSKVEELNRVFEPYFAEIHRRCCARPIGTDRHSGDERARLEAQTPRSAGSRP
ncbi:MAG: amidohydrolase family protein [Thermoleophilaceae bacterium]